MFIEILSWKIHLNDLWKLLELSCRWKEGAAPDTGEFNHGNDASHTSRRPDQWRVEVKGQQNVRSELYGHRQRSVEQPALLYSGRRMLKSQICVQEEISCYRIL